MDQKIPAKDKSILKEIGNGAVQALIYEVSFSPKPGLVDRYNSGSHKDMDYFTFLNSAFALTDYFYEVSVRGFLFSGEDKRILFDSIRGLGIEAEKKMYQATGGINTHKGLVFSLGILCCGAAHLYAEEGNVKPEKLSNISKRMTEGLLEKDLKKFANTPVSNGEKIYHNHGVTGARGEAMSGFATAFLMGYPVFKNQIQLGRTMEYSGIYTLLHMMCHLTDTNVIARHDMEMLSYVKQKAREVLQSKEEDFICQVEELDTEFIRRNVSPGGAADNLAIVIYIHLLEQIRMEQ